MLTGITAPSFNPEYTHAIRKHGIILLNNLLATTCLGRLYRKHKQNKRQESSESSATLRLKYMLPKQNYNPIAPLLQNVLCYEKKSRDI